MLSVKHLKFIITISILIVCIVLIKKNENFFNREEITDDYKTTFIANMLSFGNQPEIYKDEIKMFKMKNSKKIILENISKFTRLSDFRYLKNYSIFNKKLFFQKKPLVNINTLYSGYLITNAFTGDLKNKRYGFCIQLNNFTEEKRKQTLNNDIRDNLTEFSIVFTNKNFNTNLQKLQEINDITQQKTYESIPRRTIHLFTKYNAPYEYQPYFKKGDDGLQVRVLGKFQGTNNLKFIKDFPNGKFNILDSNLNPVLTGCSIDIPFCNIHISPFDNIKGRDDIVPGIFSHTDGKYVLINDPEYVEFKKNKEEELRKQVELMNNPKKFKSSKHQFLDLSKITDTEFHDLKNLFDQKHTELVEKNIDFYKSKGINKIPLDLYKKLQIHNTDLIVKHSLVPETGAESFTNMLFSAHERYQNMDSHFNNQIEKFQNNDLEQSDTEYEGNKYLTYNSFRECRKKENKDEQLRKFVNGEYSIIEDDNPIIKNDKETIEVVRELSGIKCREYYDKNDKRYYYGGINKEGNPECFGEEGYCKMYDTKAECELENDNVAEGFENPETISQKMINNNCQNFYITHKINNMYYKDVYNSHITNNKKLNTENIFLKLDKNYEISFDFIIHSVLDSDYKFSNNSKTDLINKGKIWYGTSFRLFMENKEKIIEKFAKIGKTITMDKLNNFNTNLKKREIYGDTYFSLNFSTPGIPYYKDRPNLDFSKILGNKTNLQNLKNNGFFERLNDENFSLTDKEQEELNKVVLLEFRMHNLKYKFPFETNSDVRRSEIWGGFLPTNQKYVDEGIKDKDENLINEGIYILNLDKTYKIKIQVTGDIGKCYLNDGEGYKLLYQKTIPIDYRLDNDEVNVSLRQLDHFRVSNFKYQKLPDSNEYNLINDKCTEIMNQSREIDASRMTTSIGIENFSNPEKRSLNYKKVDKNFNKINFMDCRYNIKNDSLCKHVDNVKVFDYKQQDFKVKTKNLVELMTFKKCKQKDFISIITNNKNISLSKELEEELNIKTNKNNIPFFLQENITNFELNKPLDYLIEPCADGYEDIHPGFLFESLEYKFKIKNKNLEITKNANSLGYILDNQNSPYILSSGDNIALYISKDNKLNVQIVNENGSRSALKKLNIQNKFGDEMNLMLRSNNTNIFQNIYHMEQQGNITYPYNPFIEISK